MNILVLMAGEGKRFKEKGYTEDKPFIKMKGVELVRWVIDNLVDDRKQHFIFVCRDNHVDELKKIVPEDSIIIPVKNTTQGAACTALLAETYINNQEPLIIANCDQYIEDTNFSTNYYNFLDKNKPDGNIVCFINEKSKWSYAKVSGGCITMVAEKNPISQFATCGIYYFSKGSDFVRCANRMIDKNDRTNGEFYLCPVYNYLIAEGQKITPYLVNQFVGLGTPEDLESYLSK